MFAYDVSQYDGYEFSVALTAELDSRLERHFAKGKLQEDLTFAVWRPSRGSSRYTAVLSELLLPTNDERILQGNVAFTREYIARVLERCPEGHGIALIHSHLGPGWQDMSQDDIVAERDRLAGVVAGRTGLPLLGLTWGTDGTWSGRFWLRVARHRYERRWASTVRVVGPRLRMSFHPVLRKVPKATSQQVATRSVWGNDAQDDVVRTRLGIIGLGSVGSLVAEAGSRTGIERITLIDFDLIEDRNLDRTIGAYRSDVQARRTKVEISKRLIQRSHTAPGFDARAISESLTSDRGLAAALDCDVLISCVDRPWPRHILNTMAYTHLIPVIDGGILARIDERGRLAHVDWTIQTVGPGRACLYCLGALLRSDAVLDRDGKLDDPDYIRGLSPEDRERYQRRNVFAFSMSVAAHEILQLVGLITGQVRVGGVGRQRYRAYPGRMDVAEPQVCSEDCDIAPLTATAGKLIE